MSKSIEQRIADIICEELGSFAAWCGKEWTMSRELAKNEPGLRELSDDYLKGYNAALEGLTLAVECYREEQAP